MKTNLEAVYEAVCELDNHEQVVVREDVAKITGLTLTQIDPALSELVNRGDIIRKQRGVFVPAVRHPPTRMITRYNLPDGTTKIEVGDDHVLNLTPKETRMLGQMMAGDALLYSNIEIGHQASYVSNDLSRQIRELKEQFKKLIEK